MGIKLPKILALYSRLSKSYPYKDDDDDDDIFPFVSCVCVYKFGRLGVFLSCKNTLNYYLHPPELIWVKFGRGGGLQKETMRIKQLLLDFGPCNTAALGSSVLLLIADFYANVDW